MVSRNRLRQSKQTSLKTLRARIDRPIPTPKLGVASRTDGGACLCFTVYGLRYGFGGWGRGLGSPSIVHTRFGRNPSQKKHFFLFMQNSLFWNGTHQIRDFLRLHEQ